MAKLLKYEIDAVVEEIYCKLQKDLKIPVIDKDPLYIEYSSYKEKAEKVKLKMLELENKSKQAGINLLKKYDLPKGNFYGYELDKVFNRNYINKKNINKDKIQRKVILSNHSSLKDIVTDVIAQMNRENN